MKLTDFLSLIGSDNADIVFETSLSFNKLSCDSRFVEPHDLFVVIPCSSALSHAQKALKAGACIVVAEKETADTLSINHPNTSIFTTPNARLALSRLARALYQKQPNNIIAVTGTNGKSSVVNMVRQLWESSGEKAAALGTLGLTLSANLSQSFNLDLPSLTTLDAINLHKTLDALKSLDVNRLAIEASSHGLHQHRLHSVQLTAAAFTNLTPDHLDYHQDMDDYLSAKIKLFSEVLPKGHTAVLNADSPYFQDLAKICKLREQAVLSYSVHKHADIMASNIYAANHAIHFDLNISDQYFPDLMIPLAGLFQLENLLCAIGLALTTGVSIPAVINSLPSLQGVSGRMENVGQKNGAPIFVDYAHTPDALKTALNNLKPHTMGKLCVVFGCGGNRDALKRPVMGAIAQEMADEIIVTDDNPRLEDPTSIRQQILAACPKAQEIADRSQAIAAAIAQLQPNDVLLIAGKGHETGQIVGTTVLPFDDKEEVIKHLQEYKND